MVIKFKKKRKKNIQKNGYQIEKKTFTLQIKIE